MPSHKDRLYIALYFHEREEAYHWAYFVSPKNDPNAPYGTTRYHVTNRLRPRNGTLQATWEYEQQTLPKVKTAKLLVQVLIGKVGKRREYFEKALRSVPVIQDNPEWRCRTWAINAMAQLARDGVLSKSSITDWEKIEGESRAYVQKKEGQGRFNTWSEITPIYDLMTRREVAV